MVWAPGKFTTCAAPKCESTRLTTMNESFDELDRIFVGQQVCLDCGASMLYSRRADTPEEIAMAKRHTARRKPARESLRKNASRGTRKALASRPATRGRPRQQDLPGTEDRAIKPLEDVAAAYADVRDRRMELNQEEAELKQHAIALMKQFDKTIYRHDGIEIRLVPGELDVKVKVKKAGEDDDEPAEIAEHEPEGLEVGEGEERDGDAAAETSH